jgi:hypothetical protein
MERILTDNEIKSILLGNVDNPVFKYQGMMMMSRGNQSHTDVLALSNKYELILIKGNDDTGHQHIRARHNYWSIHSYTIEDSDKSKRFQNQSRFPKDMHLFKELEIADQLYQSKNLVKDNTHTLAHKFDLYEGEADLEGLQGEQTRLLLYKNTRIIHSLFPVRSKHNRKRLKNFLFTRGTVEVFRNPTSGIKQTMIPYLGIDKKLAYGIFIEKFEDRNKELISVVTFENDGKIFYKNELIERDIIRFKTDTHEVTTYQYTDLREVERVILNIDQNRKKDEGSSI